MKSNTDDRNGELTVLMRAANEPEAAPIVAALEAEGIPVTTTGGFTAGFVAEAPGDIQIKVFEKDRKAAEKILAQLGVENKKIDWSKVDVGDPLED